LDEGSARRKDLYLTTQTLYKRQTSKPPVVGFEPIIPASARPQTYAVDRAASGIGLYQNFKGIYRLRQNRVPQASLLHVAVSEENAL
jgi:hypothetical protein